MQSPPMAAWIPVAEVARPHGVKGELRLRVFNPSSDLLRKKPSIRLRMPDGKERDAALVTARAVPKAMLVELEGVDSRDAAEALRGALVCVRRDAFPPLEEGELYACDVEGATATLPSGDAIGRVTSLISYPTCAALSIARSDGSTLEVPLTSTYVGRIEPGSGIVPILTLDGLE